MEQNRGFDSQARIIAANLGDNVSLKEIREEYAKEHFSKDDYLAALRAYQAALDATKSQQRNAAAEYKRLKDQRAAR